MEGLSVFTIHLQFFTSALHNPDDKKIHLLQINPLLTKEK